MIAGAAVAVIATVLSGALLAPIPGGAAIIIGIGLGGFVAGKWAKTATAYHGALSAAGWIVCAGLGLIPTPGYGSDALSDTVRIIAFDVVALAVASFGGWLARTDRVSSSGTGRAR